MDEKPRRQPRPAPGPAAQVAGFAVGAAVENFVPGGGTLADLFKRGADWLGDRIRAGDKRRLDAFYDALLSSNDAMDEQVARALLDDQDFHALLRACVNDIEVEKSGPYATLARAIATNGVPPELRRHFILSMRDLAYEELMCLRRATVVRFHPVVPGEGGGSLKEDKFLTAPAPGTLEAIRIANLVARGYVDDAKLTSLGVTFAQATWRAEELTPAALGWSTWSGRRVAIISCDLDDYYVGSLATRIAEEFRQYRVDSNIVAGTEQQVQHLLMFSSHALLLVGDKHAEIESRRNVLTRLGNQMPLVAALITPSARKPWGVEFAKVIPYAEPSAGTDWLGALCQKVLAQDPRASKNDKTAP